MTWRRRNGGSPPNHWHAAVFKGRPGPSPRFAPWVSENEDWYRWIMIYSPFWTIGNHEASTKLITTGDDRQPLTVVVGGIPTVVAWCWFNRTENPEPYMTTGRYPSAMLAMMIQPSVIDIHHSTTVLLFVADEEIIYSFHCVLLSSSQLIHGRLQSTWRLVGPDNARIENI